MDVELLKQYRPGLVVLSVAIAMLASYSALDLSGRIFATEGRARGVWLLGVAFAMGVGIWSMHFVGMLALNLSTPVAYSTPQLVASIAFAIGAAAFALWIAVRPAVGQLGLVGAAVIMGIAIAGMHYIGMSGMRMAAHVRYDTTLFRLSIAVAVVVSYAALYMTRFFRSDTTDRRRAARIGAAIVMGVAVAGMHYTGMAAAHFTANSAQAPTHETLLPPPFLAGLIAVASIVLVGLALIAAMLDRMMRSRAVESELRAQAQAAIATNMAKSEFLANMSHELRTPLNSIIGFSNILLKNKGDTLRPADITHVSRIAANGKHLLGMINGILDLSKIEAGRVELECTWLDLSSIVDDTLAEMASQADAQRVQLLTDIPADVGPLFADAARLKQVIINLVSNAVKFTNGGRVTVRVVADEHSRRPICIHVIDTGIGIPADRLESVFDAFQQAESTTTRKYGGTGLGLTITRSLAELMGWTVTVDSTLGVGSTFSVVMDAKSPEQSVGVPTPSHGAAKSAPVASGRPYVVIVIDDEADARELLQHELIELHCDVHVVSSADEGISLARTLRPDLITLDLMMPGKNGWQALRELKSDRDLSGIPVVIVSAVAEDVSLSTAGAADVINKPVTQEKLRYLVPLQTPDARVATLLSSLEEKHDARRSTARLTDGRARRNPAA